MSSLIGLVPRLRAKHSKGPDLAQGMPIIPTISRLPDISIYCVLDEFSKIGTKAIEGGKNVSSRMFIESSVNHGTLER